MQDFISVEGAAEMLLVSPRRIRQLIATGRIEGARLVGGEINPRRGVWLIPVGEDAMPVVLPPKPGAPGPKQRWTKVHPIPDSE